ncbi:MAG: hypothetical protein ABJF01_21840 [bacterium]
MSLLLGLLFVNAMVHGSVVGRYGIRNNNEPFLVFTLVYAALAVAIFLSVPYALWAVLILSLFGLVGLTVTFNKPVRSKTLDKIIWVLDVATILCAGYWLFIAPHR